MPGEPRVTVVVTCYEQADWVTQALDSVAAQTFGDWELIVTDDASGDDSAELIGRWAKGADRPVDLVLHQDNAGLTRTLNEVLPRCRGTYLAYLGGDDVWAPTKLARLVAALDAAPDAAVAYSDARTIDEDGAELAPSFLAANDELPAPEGQVFDDLLRRNVVVASSAVFRRDAVEAVGGWDPDLPFEDWDLLLRLAARWSVAFVPDALVDYRVHDRSLTRSRFSLMLHGRMTVLEKWLGRDPAQDAVIRPYLREQSWRLYKVHPDLGRSHLAIAHRDDRSPAGRAKHLIATRPVAERTFEALRRTRRRLLELLRR
jgi:glycosyltransferase involved in cell wall biosynthesis